MWASSIALPKKPKSNFSDDAMVKIQDVVFDLLNCFLMNEPWLTQVVECLKEYQATKVTVSSFQELPFFKQAEEAPRSDAFEQWQKRRRDYLPKPERRFLDLFAKALSLLLEEPLSAVATDTIVRERVILYMVSTKAIHLVRYVHEAVPFYISERGLRAMKIKQKALSSLHKYLIALANIPRSYYPTLIALLKTDEDCRWLDYAKTLPQEFRIHWLSLVQFFQKVPVEAHFLCQHIVQSYLDDPYFHSSKREL